MTLRIRQSIDAILFITGKVGNNSVAFRQNLTRATRLYERVDMHITQLYYLSEKELQPGKETRELTPDYT